MASDEQFEEPENSTVDDWLGQSVARDEEVAGQAMSEAGGDEAEAERIYEERASGEDKYEAGRPD